MEKVGGESNTVEPRLLSVQMEIFHQCFAMVGYDIARGVKRGMGMGATPPRSIRKAHVNGRSLPPPPSTLTTPYPVYIVASILTAPITPVNFPSAPSRCASSTALRPASTAATASGNSRSSSSRVLACAAHRFPPAAALAIPE